MAAKNVISDNGTETQAKTIAENPQGAAADSTLAGIVGYATVLHHADPATSWPRVCRWCARLREEELI